MSQLFISRKKVIIYEHIRTFLRPERLPATRKTVLDLDILDPHISSLSPWRNRRNVYLIYNQSEKMRGDPRITRSPNKKRKKRKRREKKEKKAEKKAAKNERREEQAKHWREQIANTPHRPYTDPSEETITPPRRDTLKAYSSARPFSIPQQGSNDSRHRRTYQHS